MIKPFAPMIRFLVSGLVCLSLMSCDKRYKARSNAMEPTIKSGQEVGVDLGAYKRRSPKRGEIVLIAPPSHLVKTVGVGDLGKWVLRIAGVPGDEVVMEGQEIVIYDSGNSKSSGCMGSVLIKAPVPTGLESPVSPPDYPIRIPDGYFYVLGDNFEKSFDSRYWGLLADERILGRVGK